MERVPQSTMIDMTKVEDYEEEKVPDHDKQQKYKEEEPKDDGR